MSIYLNRNNSDKKKTNRYNFLKAFLKEKRRIHSRFLSHIIGNLPACFQIYGLFVRNLTACFGFYFMGSYCVPFLLRFLLRRRCPGLFKVQMKCFFIGEFEKAAKVRKIAVHRFLISVLVPEL